MVTPAPSATQTPAAPRWHECLQALQGLLPPDWGSRRRGWRCSRPLVSVQPAPTPAVPLLARTLCTPLSLIPRSHVVLHPMAPPRGPLVPRGTPMSSRPRCPARGQCPAPSGPRGRCNALPPPSPTSSRSRTASAVFCGYLGKVELSR